MTAISNDTNPTRPFHPLLVEDIVLTIFQNVPWATLLKWQQVCITWQRQARLICPTLFPQYIDERLLNKVKALQSQVRGNRLPYVIPSPKTVHEEAVTTVLVVQKQVDSYIVPFPEEVYSNWGSLSERRFITFNNDELSESTCYVRGDDRVVKLFFQNLPQGTIVQASVDTKAIIKGKYLKGHIELLATQPFSCIQTRCPGGDYIKSWAVPAENLSHFVDSVSSSS